MLHLNVLNPLWQTQKVSQRNREEARSDLTSSDDPEIANWPAFRAQMISVLPKTKPKLPGFDELEAGVVSLIREDILTLS